jgi:hypothetical protein
MKKNKYIIGLFLSLMLVFYCCQEEDQEFGDIITPTNILITAEIVGVDATNPNGDGSGTVNFSATADNAISYKFVYNGIETSSPNGKITYNFAVLGLTTYTVTVVATGTAGVASSADIQVDVLSTYAPPAELLDKLHGGTSKTWRIKNESDSHFGLGPTPDKPDFQNFFAQYFSAGADTKAGVGMYNDRYIFNSDGIFTHITDAENDATGDDPTGDIFGRDPLIYNDLGNSGTGTIDGEDVLNYPFDDYNENWFLSAPGGVETLNLTGTAFIGYYIANHTYEIFDRSTVSNEIVLRIVDANGEFYWWFTLISD